jgi:hypothetical protein
MVQDSPFHAVPSSVQVSRVLEFAHLVCPKEHPPLIHPVPGISHPKSQDLIGDAEYVPDPLQAYTNDFPLTFIHLFTPGVHPPLATDIFFMQNFPPYEDSQTELESQQGILWHDWFTPAQALPEDVVHVPPVGVGIHPYLQTAVVSFSGEQ